MLTQSTGQVTCKYEKKNQINSEGEQKHFTIHASLQNYDVEAGSSLTVFCPYSSKAIV